MLLSKNICIPHILLCRFEIRIYFGNYLQQFLEVSGRTKYNLAVIKILQINVMETGYEIYYEFNPANSATSKV